MENQKEEHMRCIAGIVYVVTADTWEESAADYKDRVGLNHGVLRIFTNKDDAYTYMRRYYDEIKPEHKSINISEDSAGAFSLQIKARVKNIKGAISFDGFRLSDRTHVEVMRCEAVKLTTEVNDGDVELASDYWDRFFG